MHVLLSTEVYIKFYLSVNILISYYYFRCFIDYLYFPPFNWVIRNLIIKYTNIKYYIIKIFMIINSNSIILYI